MRTIRFDVQGFSRTYWDFFVGAGFTVGVFLLFAAVLAWQLGGLRRQTLRDMPVVSWALAIVFVGVTVLSWMYLFIIPVILSALISMCLIIAAWLAAKQGREQA
jgi:intracellular septation protein A